jgi:hypothetical protein
MLANPVTVLPLTRASPLDSRAYLRMETPWQSAAVTLPAS